MKNHRKEETWLLMLKLLMLPLGMNKTLMQPPPPILSESQWYWKVRWHWQEDRAKLGLTRLYFQSSMFWGEKNEYIFVGRDLGPKWQRKHPVNNTRSKKKQNIEATKKFCNWHHKKHAQQWLATISERFSWNSEY